MKQTLLSAILAIAATSASANQADSVYVASYHIGWGLRMAYSVDKNHWTTVGDNFNLLQSDYGAWGAEKKMVSAPSVLRDEDGQWYAVWGVNKKSNQFATSHTRDLACWIPQDYPFMTTEDEDVENPQLTKNDGIFYVTYSTSKGNTYTTSSKDFIHWSKAVEAAAAHVSSEKAFIEGAEQEICINRAPWKEMSELISKAEAAGYRASRDNRGMGDDDRIFGKVKDLKATLKADLSKSKAISPDLFGIFFEDINYSADGGLYAELLQNRDFEYNGKDHKDWNAKTAWSLKGDGTTWTTATENPIHKNNATYSVLDVKSVGACLVNEGFDGIAVKKNEKYDFSIFLRTLDGKAKKIRVRLMDGDKTLAEQTLTAKTGEWSQINTVLTANASCSKATLAIEPLNEGQFAVDFASLFPQKTFKNRKNGMRQDLAQTLADIHPKFVRFPGGCASHGNGINNIYHWKSTIGKLWERESDFNIWHYHQSRGLGFYEYFQFCEDIGAKPLPVLSAGVPCQNSSIGGNGQQGGIPWEKDLKAEGKESPYIYNGKPLTMESYLQELLDLIEWANGDPKTSSLAKMRAEAGHPKPFGLKMLGVGNEDLISNVFAERYTWLIKEIQKVHPEITIVGTVGPFWEGSDYETGWDIARQNDIPVVDEHYYNPVGWYLNHQDFYDKYARTGTKVYLGEWASKGNRWENALAEAIHITNIERNADVVTMSSYAPLLARLGHTQWNPDLIYFNGTEVFPTPNYYVQMLSGQNSGTEYIFSDCTVSDQVASDRVKASIVRNDNGEVILKLVNALPAETTLSLDIPGITDFNTATIQQMAAPRDTRDLSPEEVKTVTDMSTMNSLLLPAYSFTVVKLSNSKKK